jgi:hypothetical protein
MVPVHGEVTFPPPTATSVSIQRVWDEIVGVVGDEATGTTVGDVRVVLRCRDTFTRIEINGGRNGCAGDTG